MTDSTVRDPAGKRDRLVVAALDLVHRQGVLATTLAQVAQAAGVPVGNVYYYFKTKDDLVRGVIDARAQQARAMLASLEAAHVDPAARLKALAHSWVEMRDLVVRYGCPFGTLSMELDKREDGLDREAAILTSLILDWAQQQFRAMGRHDARELAITLFAGVQGGSQLASALRDPDLLTGHVHRIEQWIDTLA